MKDLPKEIESHLNGIQRILTLSKRLCQDSKALLLTDTNQKFQLVHRSPFLSRVRESFFSLSVIELCKILGNPKSNHYSLKALISKIPSDNQAKTSWSSRIEELAVKESLAKLQVMRDKHFAHNDMDAPNLHSIKLYYDDLEALILLAENISIEIAMNLMHSQLNFERYSGEDVNNLLNTMILWQTSYGKELLKKK
jgi:hypothetical protein